MTGREQHRKCAGPDTYRGHWTIFLPSLAVALLYGGAWLALVATGKSDTALAKLALLVLALVVPLLAAVAYLRFRALRVELAAETLSVRHGWLRPHWQRLTISDITDARVERSLVGRKAGGGALSLKLADGTRCRILDIASPEVLAREINLRAGKS